MALWLLFQLFTSAATAPPVRFALRATDGKEYRSAQLEKSRAAVLIFLATDCPISNRYSPLLRKLDDGYRSKGISFFAIFSDGRTRPEEARKYMEEYGLPMPGLLDPKATLARQTGARVTPEAVVLSAAGSVLYRGRIDDRYVDWGKTRPTATQQDLRDTLDAVLANQPVPHPVTNALGCAINVKRE